MDVHDVRPNGRRRVRSPQRGDEVDLWLRAELVGELAPPTAAARVRELRARGIERLRVRVVKVPWGEVLTAEDAVKIEAPELMGETGDIAVYVRLEFLDLPTI